MTTESDIIRENFRLDMWRPDLNGIQEYPVPSPFRIRDFQAGDIQSWIDIHLQADHHNVPDEMLFRREFTDDEVLWIGRQLYLCDGGGKPIGTSTAWFGRSNIEKLGWGRIHWVAIKPDFQGLGLAKPLLAASCRRLAELGHRKTWLRSSSARIPAISLYLKFGFIPEITDDDSRLNWQRMKNITSLNFSLPEE